MSKLKETEALLLIAADTLVKMRAALKLTSAKNATALNEVLTSPEAKQVFKWRTARRKELKNIDTVPAKVVTSAVVGKESKKDRAKRHVKDDKIITSVANASAKLLADQLDEGALSAKEAKRAASKRSTGKDGVKGKASKLSELSDAVNPNKKSRVPFYEKVKVEIANRVDAGGISKKLMRQAHAYVDKHHLKVEHMQDLKLKAAVDKVLRLTVKANSKAE